MIDLSRMKSVSVNPLAKSARFEPGRQLRCRHGLRVSAAAEKELTQLRYVNEIAHDDPANRVLATYGKNHSRLVELKKRYDPGNVFRMNANVSPKA
ncbi:MAG: BBE domain-containing protein [Gammaproteobacteria bacterium]